MKHRLLFLVTCLLCAAFAYSASPAKQMYEAIKNQTTPKLSLSERYVREFDPTILAILIKQAQLLQHMPITFDGILKTFFVINKDQFKEKCLTFRLSSFAKDIEKLTMLITAGFQCTNYDDFKRLLSRLNAEHRLPLVCALGRQNFTKGMMKRIKNKNYCDTKLKFGGPVVPKIVAARKRKRTNKKINNCFLSPNHWTKFKKIKRK